MASDLGWFYGLKLGEQVDLLRDPHRDVTGQLAERLSKAGPGVYAAQWAPSGDPVRWNLNPEAARQLAAAGLQLDHWWQNLDADQRVYVVENRAGELAAEYRDVVLAASLDPVTHAPYGHLVVTVSDNQTGRFRLPKLIRIYVDALALREDRKRQAIDIVSRYRPILGIRDIERAGLRGPEFNFNLGGVPLAKVEYKSLMDEFAACQIWAGIDSRVDPD